MSEIVVATNTFFPKMNTRAECALRTMREAKDRDIRLVVVDGGSCSEFRGEALKLTTLYRNPGSSFGAAFRHALGTAGRVAKEGSGYVLWMTPEMYPMLEELDSLDFLIQYDVNFAVLEIKEPRVTPGPPGIRWYATNFLNKAFYDITGKSLRSVYCCPVFLSQDALPFFLDYDGEHGDRWNAILIPIVRVIASDMEVFGYPTEYFPSPELLKERNKNLRDFILEFAKNLHEILPALATEAERLGLPRDPEG